MTKTRVSPHGGYLNEGAISSGTLRTQDLLRAFSEELKRLKPFNTQGTVRLAEALADQIDKDDGTYETSTEHEGKEVIHELMEELNHLSTPHGLYFGTTEGDGACFGFWRVETEECERWIP